MRSLFIGLLMLLGGAPLQAGVYHRREIALPLPTELSENNGLQSRRNDLRSVDDRANLDGPDKAKQDSFRALYFDEVKQMEAKDGKEPLTSEQKLDLSADYIRLGRNAKAIDLIEKQTLPALAKDDPYRFLLLANLAAAYWGSNVPSRAIEWQKQSLAAWPTRFQGWTWEQWFHYRRSEKALLTLMQSRQMTLEGGRPPTETAPDPLFPGVRWTGLGDKYVIGGIDPVTAEKLPGDAEPIVVQLMLWLPTDDILYWQYGELLNAKGKVADALKVLDLLVSVSGMSNNKELFQHRRLLKSAKIESPVTKSTPPSTGFEAPPSVPQTAAPPPSWIPDWRALVIGFLAGVLIAVVVSLQWKEWKRAKSRR